MALALLSNPPPVVFTYADAKAKDVSIAGDFNTWEKPFEMSREGAKWTKSFDLPSDARIEYKFVVDGKWILDPANKNRCGNGLGGENSVWQGPDYKFNSDDAPPAHPLKRTSITVEGREIVVFAPDKPQGSKLLILGDGPNYETIGKVQNVVANLAAEGKIRPLVIVLIPPVDRMKEYGSEWEPYGRYVFGTVLPAVRALTGAGAKPEDVYMGGSSLGGLIALRLAEEFPQELAGGVLCQSAAVQYDPLGLKFNEAMSEDKLTRIAKTAKVWLDWGTFEDGLTTANLALTKTLTEMERPFGSLTTDEGHTWTAWRNRLQDGLIYLLAPKNSRAQ